LVIMTFERRIGLGMSCRRRVEPPGAGQRPAGEHCQEGRKSSRTHPGRLSATEPVFTTWLSGEKNRGARMYILYSVLLALALLASLAWWVVQLLRLGKYRAGLKERLGLVPARLARGSQDGSIWIHAVSVGEVVAISHLLEELQKANPKTKIYVSTTTATGQRLARDRFGEDRVFFMPLDFRFALRAYLDCLRPRLLILAEAGFWPNLLHYAKRREVAIAIVNARASDRSFPRYRRFCWFFSRILSQVDLFLTQTEADAQRLRAIGAPAERVQVSGNMKFDVRSASGSSLAEAIR